ncbi:MAG: HNH endonuclease [Anaerolineales bacterium]|nr:HNH endonuclease [Anaerolineales bacterium]
MALGGKIRSATRQAVRQRAAELCEYCHTSERWQYVSFTIDHVIPLSKGGTDGLENLALSCFHCNRKKGSRTKAMDPVTAEEVFLYNPRNDDWQAHFIWSSDGLRIVGTTAIGRATVAALDLNRERILNIRSADRSVGRHPPVQDPLQKEQRT